MRTSVGPLSAAVYWRRRAVVLGGLLLGVLVVFISCSGGDKPDPRGGGAQSSRSASPQGTPETEPSFEDAPPGNGPALPDPAELSSDEPAPGQTGGPAVTVAAVPADQCTDAEISVTPVPARTAARRGEAIELRLKIKNVSARVCNRDVGADLQEIYVKQGASKVWSSDICGLAKGSEVLRFTPSFEREYRVTWNGKTASKCAGGLAVGPVPAAGEYAVLGRLGGKVSAPVRLALIA